MGAIIKKCIKKMKKSTRLGLLETEDKSVDEKKKRKCPSDKVVKKCVQKMKKLKPKQKACKTLEKISKKDLDSILELIKKWNRQKCSRRTANLTVERPNITMWTAWQITLPSSGKKLKKGCDLIKHFQRRLKTVTCNRIKVATYNCKCTRVIKEKKICNIFNGCYAASVRAKKNNEKKK